jgi:hypothetical protein
MLIRSDYRVLFQKFVDTQVVKKFFVVMESKGASQCNLQVLATGLRAFSLFHIFTFSFY